MMLASMTAKQFREWQTYADLEPFEERRADARAAQIVATILNVNRGMGSKILGVEDVLLQFEDPVEKSIPEPDWKKMKAVGMMSIKALLGDEEKQKGRKSRRRRYSR